MRHERIVSDPEVMLGKPCIKGTRIAVELILRYLDSGQSVDDVVEAVSGPHARGCARRPELGAGGAGCAARRRGRALRPDPGHPVRELGARRGRRGQRHRPAGGARRRHAGNKLGWRSAFEARKDFHQAVDIVPCRRRWFEAKRKVIGSLAHMAAEDGVVVYERH